MLRDKLEKRGERPFLAYLDKFILSRQFSRCDGPPGQACGTAGHERSHATMKGGCFFSNIAGMGNAIQNATTVGRNLFTLQERVARVPKSYPDLWKKAQKLIAINYMGISWHITLNDEQCIIVPSTKMLKEHVPDTLTTWEDKRKFVKTWAAEYTAMLKNPDRYVPRLCPHLYPSFSHPPPPPHPHLSDTTDSSTAHGT
jgi:hypothetical protein